MIDIENNSSFVSERYAKKFQKHLIQKIKNVGNLVCIWLKNLQIAVIFMVFAMICYESINEFSGKQNSEMMSTGCYVQLQGYILNSFLVSYQRKNWGV